MGAPDSLPRLRRIVGHISESMASNSSSTEQQDAMGSAKPFPASPNNTKTTSRPLPPQPLAVSRFSQWFQRRVQRPACTHTTMTRLYGAYSCENCRHPGTSRWLYCCTQDTDEVLRASLQAGDNVAFDELGKLLVQDVKPACRGAEARADKYSLLKELSPEQMASYTPAQIATLLRQREDVQNAAKLDQARQGIPESKTPWVPSKEHECHYLACQFCRPLYRERTYMSLNAIANGDISPSAAAGYGFDHSAGRPVVDASLLMNLGCRAVPLPHPVSIASPGITTPVSMRSFFELVDAELRDETAVQIPSNDLSRSGADIMMNDHPSDVSPTVLAERFIPNVAMTCQPQRSLATAGDLTVRPPWTPPASPKVKAQKGHENEIPDAELVYPPFNGRSPSSLKLNLDIRKKVLGSFSNLTTALERLRPGPSKENTIIGEDDFDAGLVLRIKRRIFERACNTPLPPFDIDEELALARYETPPSSRHGQDGSFGAGPLVVPEGVAVMEESVELGEADVITQL